MSDKKQPNLTDMLSNLMSASGAIDPAMLKQEYAWYKSFSYPDVPNFKIENVMSFASSSLFSKALTDNLILYRDSDSMSLSRVGDPEFSMFRKVIDSPRFLFYINDKAALSIQKTSFVSISVISLDKSIIQKALKECRDFYEQMETE